MNTWNPQAALWRLFYELDPEPRNKCCRYADVGKIVSRWAAHIANLDKTTSGEIHLQRLLCFSKYRQLLAKQKQLNSICPRCMLLYVDWGGCFGKRHRSERNFGVTHKCNQFAYLEWLFNTSKFFEHEIFLWVSGHFYSPWWDPT